MKTMHQPLDVDLEDILGGYNTNLSNIGGEWMQIFGGIDSFNSDDDNHFTFLDSLEDIPLSPTTDFMDSTGDSDWADLMNPEHNVMMPAALNSLDATHNDTAASDENKTHVCQDFVVLGIPIESDSIDKLLNNDASTQQSQPQCQSGANVNIFQFPPTPPNTPGIDGLMISAPSYSSSNNNNSNITNNNTNSTVGLPGHGVSHSLFAMNQRHSHSVPLPLLDANFPALSAVQRKAVDQRRPRPAAAANNAGKPARAVHNDERPFICDWQGCNKVYSKSSHLRAHKRRHTGEKPFHCPHAPCQWSFSRSDELARHKRSHTGDKPYPCDMCDKRFGRSDHLAKHKRVHQRNKTGTPGTRRQA